MRCSNGIARSGDDVRSCGIARMMSHSGALPPWRPNPQTTALSNPIQYGFTTKKHPLATSLCKSPDCKA